MEFELYCYGPPLLLLQVPYFYLPSPLLEASVSQLLSPEVASDVSKFKYILNLGH